MELKQKKKFESQWKNITTLTNETTPEKTVKVENEEVISIFKEISEERIKKAKENFKIKLTAVLEAKLALDKNLQKGREDLQKQEEKEYEVLNKELGSALGFLNGTKKEGNALVQAASGNFEQEGEPEGDTEPKEEGEATT
jgi:hypothetical protein